MSEPCSEFCPFIKDCTRCQFRGGNHTERPG